jgi:hypothetical protein
MNMKYHTFILVLIISLSGCESWDRYLANHRSEMAGQTFSYIQVGRIEFYGPFDSSLLQQNQAWPASPEDAKAIQDSYAITLAQPVSVDGKLVYPAIPQTKRIIHIAHHVRWVADQEPAPQWFGPVIHERTVVPWSGDESARYENGWHYQRQYQRQRDDRPEGRMTTDAPPQDGVRP